MTTVEQPRSAGLIARVQAILLRPASEWPVIAAEPATPQTLFTGYACILAAIPAIAGFIGRQLFGFGAFGFTYRPPIVSSAVSAILTYVLSLVAVWVLAMIIDVLAPSFDGQRDRLRALKLAVYANTAGWVAGILLIVPMLGIIAGLCGLYGLYLLYLGLPRLMNAPQEKALGYTAVTVIAAIILYIIVGAIVGAIAGLALFGGAVAGIHPM